MGNTDTTLDVLERLREIIPDEREFMAFCSSRAMSQVVSAAENGSPFVMKRTDTGFTLTVVNWGDL